MIKAKVYFLEYVSEHHSWLDIDSIIIYSKEFGVLEGIGPDYISYRKTWKDFIEYSDYRDGRRYKLTYLGEL